MKKRYLAIIPLLFTLCACGEGSNTESQATSKPSQSISATVDNSNDNMTDPLYKVTVLLPNGEKYNKSGAQAQWCATT